MSNRSHSLKRIISTLCAFAAVSGASAMDKDGKDATIKRSSSATNLTVKRNFFERAVDTIKRNPGKTLLGGAATGGLIASSVYAYNKIKGKKAEPTNTAAVAVEATNSANVASNQQFQQLKAKYDNEVAKVKGYHKASNVSIDSDLITVKRRFSESQKSRFSSRDGYIAKKLSDLGFSITLNKNNCSVFDLTNANYSFYVFDFDGNIPDGAKDFVKRIDGTNICYAFGKGNKTYGSRLEKPLDYQITLNQLGESLNFSLGIDTDKL